MTKKIRYPVRDPVEEARKREQEEDTAFQRSFYSTPEPLPQRLRPYAALYRRHKRKSRIKST